MHLLTTVLYNDLGEPCKFSRNDMGVVEVTESFAYQMFDVSNVSRIKRFTYLKISRIKKGPSSNSSFPQSQDIECSFLTSRIPAANCDIAPSNSCFHQPHSAQRRSLWESQCDASQLVPTSLEENQAPPQLNADAKTHRSDIEAEASIHTAFHDCQSRHAVRSAL